MSLETVTDRLLELCRRIFLLNLVVDQSKERCLEYSWKSVEDEKRTGQYSPIMCLHP